MSHLLIAVPHFPERFPDAWQYLKESGLDLTSCPSLASLSPKQRASLYPVIDGLFLAGETADPALLSQLPELSAIGKMGAGMDNIDLSYCARHEIRVINSKGQNSNAVAEMALALLLCSLRHILPQAEAARTGNWEKRSPGRELSHKTVGLYGFGQISQRLAQLLAPFCVRLLAYDPYFSAENGERLHVQSVSPEQLTAQSDIISIHIPALPENRGIFDDTFFASMKPGAFFLNCARGSLVQEDALYKALQSGHLAGAASDVFSMEPVPSGNPLFTLEQFIGTPHIAGMTQESMSADSMTVARTFVQHLQTERRTDRL